MKCKNCGITVRKNQTGMNEYWVHYVEVPGTSRTSAAYIYCNITVAEPEVTDE